jgi:hypothetical protein
MAVSRMTISYTPPAQGPLLEQQQALVRFLKLGSIDDLVMRSLCELLAVVEDGEADIPSLIALHALEHVAGRRQPQAGQRIEFEFRELEDGPTMNDFVLLCRDYALDFDGLVTLALVANFARVMRNFNDPNVMRQFDLGA